MGEHDSRCEREYTRDGRHIFIDCMCPIRAAQAEALRSAADDIEREARRVLERGKRRKSKTRASADGHHAAAGLYIANRLRKRAERGVS